MLLAMKMADNARPSPLISGLNAYPRLVGILTRAAVRGVVRASRNGVKRKWLEEQNRGIDVVAQRQDKGGHVFAVRCEEMRGVQITAAYRPGRELLRAEHELRRPSGRGGAVCAR